MLFHNFNRDFSYLDTQSLRQQYLESNAVELIMPYVNGSSTDSRQPSPVLLDDAMRKEVGVQLGVVKHLYR